MQYINLNKKRGFTLIEIMVVVVILGILAILIVPNIVGKVDEARVTKAKADIATLESGLDLYRLDSGIYPSTEQGLQALEVKPTITPIPMNWKGPYQKRLPNDPWGEPYQYRNPGTHGNIDIFSFGPNGLAAQDETGYISNWDSK